ncbi:MAG: hypothetical protein ACLT3H_00920 [Roseburia sp.]
MRAQRIKISLLPGFEVISLTGTQRVNDHGSLKLSGYISGKQEDEILSQSLEDYCRMEVAVIGENGTEHKWFEGVLISSEIRVENEKRMLMLYLKTGTYLMDITPHIRSFQSPGITYRAIFDTFQEEYGRGAAIFHVEESQTAGHMILQYQETDWQFAKRMASRFHAVLIPDARFGFPVYSVGVSGRSPVDEIETKTYTLEKRIGDYMDLNGKGVGTVSEADMYVYHYASREVYYLGDTVLFNGKMVCVCEVKSEMVGGELCHFYLLAPQRAMQVPKSYNQNLVGLSLQGRVGEVRRDCVTVAIDGDENRGKSGTRLYPFSTMYSSEDGTGWYFMPEVSDTVRLCFPTEDEKDAFAVNAVHVQGKAAGKRSNPSFKSLMNRQGKEILFTPSCIRITNNAGMSIELNDSEGIQIVSDKSIRIASEALLDIKSSTDVVRLSAPHEIIFKQGNTEMDLKEKMTFKGAQVRLD